jgi:hypothetical protein
MNEKEKEEIELDIEAKYVGKTEKEFLSRLTYAECLYILTPENEYRDEVIKLSVLKICEIIEKTQKENEDWSKAYKEEKDKQFEILQKYRALKQENEKLKDKLLDTLEGQKVIKEETPQYIKENYISVQKIEDKIQELKQELRKLDKEDPKKFEPWTRSELEDGIYIELDILEELLKEDKLYGR